MRLLLVLVCDDAGARASNLMQAAPVGRGAGKSGQSPKGSQGRSKLLRMDGGLGWHGLVSRGISESSRHGEALLNPREPGRVAWRRASGVSAPSTASRWCVLTATAGPMPGDRGKLVELGVVGLRISLPVLPPAVKQEDEEGNNDDDGRCPTSEGRPIELEERIRVAALVDDSIIICLPLVGRLLSRGL